MAQQQQQRPILNRPISLLNRNGLLLLLLLALFVILGVFLPLTKSPLFLFPNTTTSSSLPPPSSSLPSISDWRDYSLAQAAKFVAKNETVIVCAVSYPFLPFLSNWLISISRQKHHEKVLVIAEDYATLYKVNEKWPGHAVLIPPALDPQSAHKFGSQGFYNLTSRRPQHLLNILELGYNVMYNDVDMVWLQDPFDYLQGSHDVYFMDDMIAVKPLNHSHDLPPLSRGGVTYVCSCMIFLRSTDGAKLLMKKWVEEIQAQRWSNTEAKKPHDQPAFNRALHKTAHQVDAYLLPQSAFPSGGLYFRNETWVNETKGKHVIVHNNYIIGYDKKMKRFQDFNLWLLDDHALESPLGILKIYQEQQNTTEGKNQRKTGRKQRRTRGKKQKLP
ncbi:PREDICTED: UDP-D-xylose:L-fucose alpha-1,3-D-xylosyltransferase 3 [Camelina sativa]|uniref:Glycosyltransferase n=1 Tax=Camelina sativa TaxID=90675 RepID=A0ABM0SRB2_CAMSA|nr:PREDICTED: UDP-D-xylose:L-fucose alpha-1,3-D-xylosyltransferase 3 [Camelina sativa]